MTIQSASVARGVDQAIFVRVGDFGLLKLLASAAVFAVITWLLEMIVVGILSLFVTVPSATVWALIVRTLAPERQVV
jgi:hypothetical protein